MSFFSIFNTNPTSLELFLISTICLTLKICRWKKVMSKKNKIRHVISWAKKKGIFPLGECTMKWDDPAITSLDLGLEKKSHDLYSFFILFYCSSSMIFFPKSKQSFDIIQQKIEFFFAEILALFGRDLIIFSMFNNVKVY